MRSDIHDLDLAEGMDKRLSLFLENHEQTEMFVEWNTDGFEKIMSFSL